MLFRSLRPQLSPGAARPQSGPGPGGLWRAHRRRGEGALRPPGHSRAHRSRPGEREGRGRLGATGDLRRARAGHRAGSGRRVLCRGGASRRRLDSARPRPVSRDEPDPGRIHGLGQDLRGPPPLPAAGLCLPRHRSVHRNGDRLFHRRHLLHPGRGVLPRTGIPPGLAPAPAPEHRHRHRRRNDRHPRQQGTAATGRHHHLPQGPQAGHPRTPAARLPPPQGPRRRRPGRASGISSFGRYSGICGVLAPCIMCRRFRLSH